MKIILASKSGVRKEILDKHKIDNEVIFLMSMKMKLRLLLAEGASPLLFQRI